MAPATQTAQEIQAQPDRKPRTLVRGGFTSQNKGGFSICMTGFIVFPDKDANRMWERKKTKAARGPAGSKGHIFFCQRSACPLGQFLMFGFGKFCARCLFKQDSTQSRHCDEDGEGDSKGGGRTKRQRGEKSAKDKKICEQEKSNEHKFVFQMVSKSSGTM